MEENGKKNVVNHFEPGSNCQVFNGNISSCVFAMPGSNVTQNSQGKVPSEFAPEGQSQDDSQRAVGSMIRDEELFHFIHPSVDGKQEWQIHDEVKRLVSRQGIQEKGQ